MIGERFVLDASVAISWFFPDTPENHRYAAAVLDAIREEAPTIVVPDLFHCEVAEFLLRRRRHKPARFGAAKLAAALDALDGLGMETHHLGLEFRALIDLAQLLHLQATDALYFSLAQALKVPIASLDGGIRTACRAHAVKLLTFN